MINILASKKGLIFDYFRGKRDKMRHNANMLYKSVKKYFVGSLILCGAKIAF